MPNILQELLNSLFKGFTNKASYPTTSKVEPQINPKEAVIDPYHRWTKGELRHLSQHVKTVEVECHRCSLGSPQKISKEVLSKFEKLRTLYGKPIRITSGYRCLEHNRLIGSSDSSQHPKAEALDIQPLQFNTVKDLEELYKCCEKIFKAIGDARYRSPTLLKNFIHVDSRNDRVYRWKY